MEHCNCAFGKLNLAHTNVKPMMLSAATCLHTFDSFLSLNFNLATPCNFSR
jgi:hypothetical protein